MNENKKVETVRNMLFILSLFLVSFIYYDCSEEDPFFIELSDSVLEFPFEGGVNTLGIDCNSNWRVIDIPDWCSINDKFGEGSKTIRIQVTANPDDLERKAELSVSLGNLKKTFTVIQKGLISTKLLVSVSELYFLSVDDEKSFEINTDGKWQISGIPDWCVITKKEGIGNSEIIIKSHTNYTSNVNKATLIISSGQLSKEITIYQNKQIPPNTIEVKVPGTLKSELLSMHLENTDKLTIWGEINADDFVTLRKMSQLTDLNIENVIIQRVYAYNPYSYSWEESPENALPIYAFLDCIKLESIVLPASINTIKNYAFKNCENLKSIVIPDKVAIVEDYIFSRCNHLQSVVISKQMKRISNGMFEDCSALSQLDIPANIIEIGEFAFWKCAFTTMSIPSTIKKIGSSAFSSCEKLETVYIPESVIQINTGNLFFGCKNLTSIHLPNYIKELGSSTFWGCSSLKSIKLPDQLEIINNQIFWECSNLTSITIPAKVTKIHEGVFGRCTMLKEIHVLNPVPPELTFYTWGTFQEFDCTACKVYVPKESFDSYRLVYWASWGSFFRNNIIGI